jgi:hypothetical protein
MGIFGRRRESHNGNPNRVDAASLQAAGFRIKHDDTEQLRRLIQPWHYRSFSYYDQLGEIKYASQFYSRMLAPLRLYAAEIDENGEWVETENEQAVAALERIQDPGGGRESLLSSYGRLMFLVGETYLLVTLDEDGDEQWEMLSTDELRIQSGVIMRYRAPSLNAEELKEPSDDDWEPLDERTAIAYRLWKRHPRYSMLSDSTMQGVLDLCEELLLLSRAVRARTRSRLASAGILAISEDFSYAPLEPEPDEDPQSDPFLADLTAAMMAAIQNEGSASAAVPMVVRGTTEAVEKGIRHIQIVDPTQLYPETGLRYELIKRIALGLDMPPEVLLGLTDANHWTAWQIDEQTWKGHGMPLANQFVNDLNAAYFRPELRDAGVPDWKRYGIRYDASEIINHPDRTKDAKDLHDRMVIGDEALRDAGGFDETDAPTPDELNRMIGLAVRDGSLALYGIPSVRSGGIEPEAGVIEQGGTEGGTPTESTGASVEPGPPADGETPEDPAVIGSAARQMELARLAGACDLALLRAREVAGNRLKSLAKRDSGVTAKINGTPARDIAATLGPEIVERIARGVSTRELVAPASDLLADSIRVYGFGETATALVVEQIERHAAKTLFELRPSPLPPQFPGWLDGVLKGN